MPLLLLLAASAGVDTGVIMPSEPCSAYSAVTAVVGISLSVGIHTVGYRRSKQPLESIQEVQEALEEIVRQVSILPKLDRQRKDAAQVEKAGRQS